MRRPIWLAAIISLLLLTTGCDRNGQSKTLNDYPLTKITDKVYIVQGSIDLPNERNKGFINNPGIVLTDHGAVVIDPGSSAAIGRMVLLKVKTLTDKPVIAIFNTHIHGDHWLGNGVIKDAFPKAVIYAHPEMLALAKAGEGANWVKLLNDLTKGAITGTKPRVPDLAINNGETLKLGDTSFRIYHTGKAHTNNDIMIEVVGERVLFLGDIVLNGRIGRMTNGNIKGNITAIETALNTKAEHFIPGHGKNGGRAVPQAYLTYFQTIYKLVKKYAAEDMLDYEIKPKVVAQLEAYKDWKQFKFEVGRHVNYAYGQIQDELF